MKVTRHEHTKFLNRAIPLLTLAYFIQCYFYLEYFPTQFTKEVVAVLGLSLIGLFLYSIFYNRYHHVDFNSHSFEIRVDPIKYREEFSYREIVDVEIKGKNAFQHVVIHLESGETIKLSNVDEAHQIRKYLLKLS